MPKLSDKDHLRREAMARREALDAPWRAAASRAIARRILDSQAARRGQRAALFASFNHEVDTHDLIRRMLERRVQVALPLVLRSQRRLELRVVERFPEDCRPGPFGILQPDPLLCPRILAPDELDVIFVPGLLFSRRGDRLGYGLAYYDRLLEEASQVTSIGLAFSMQVVDQLPRDPWDRPVNSIVTEIEWIETTAR
jgi:5-formyltetrahydrofolate cyclo-ligase